MVVLAPLVLSNPAVRRDYAVGPGRGEPGGVAFSSMGGRRWHLVSREATDVLLIARAPVGDFPEAAMIACSLLYVVLAPQFVA